MATGMKTEFEIRLVDNVSASLLKIQKIVDRLNFNSIDNFIKNLSGSGLKTGLKNMVTSFESLASTSSKLSTHMNNFNSSLRGINAWGKRAIDTQMELQRIIGLIGTKITDASLIEFNNRAQLDLDISKPEDKLKLLNGYLKDVDNQAQKWALGVGEFANIAPMSKNEYLASIKQLLSSGLTEVEATLATKYSSVMSKALEATHADAAYDMARIYNNIKAVTPKDGLINKEDTMKRISSIFDYMDNNFQFKIGKNTITQLRKTLSVGLTRGFKLEELGIAAGFISSTGLEGGMGDTALKEFISRLSIAETKAKKFGLPFEYIGNETLPEIITKLKEATLGLDKKGRADFLREAFGERGVQAAERIIEQADAISEHIKKAQDATAGFGSAYNSAYMRSQDFNTALEGFNSRLDVYNGTVGKYTVGVRWMFTDLFNNAVSYLAGTENIIGSFAGKVLGSVAVTGGVFASLGTDFITLASGPIQFLGNMGLAMNGLDQMIPLLQDFGREILKLSSKMWAFSLTVFKNVFSLQFWTNTLWAAIGATVKLGLQVAWLAIKYTVYYIALAVGAIAQGIYNVLMWLSVPPTLIVGGTIFLVVAAVLALGAAIFWLWKNWTSVWSSLGEGVKSLVTFVKDMYLWIWKLLDGFMEKVFGGLWRGVKKFFGWIFSGIKKIVDFISSYFDGDKIMAGISGDPINFDVAEFNDSGDPLLGGREKGKGSSDFTLPAGYAYQIDNRFSGSKGISDVVQANENARVIIPETQLDVLQKIYNFLVSTWGDGSTNSIITSPTASGVSVGAGDKIINITIENIDQIWEVVEFVEFLKEKINRI